MDNYKWIINEQAWIKIRYTILQTKIIKINNFSKLSINQKFQNQDGKIPMKKKDTLQSVRQEITIPTCKVKTNLQIDNEAPCCPTAQNIQTYHFI